MGGGEPPTGERPRWSFTWLLRIQRTGHRRRPLPPDLSGHRLLRAALWVALAGVLLVEVWLGIVLGVLPR